MELDICFWLSFYVIFFLISAFLGYQKGQLVAGLLLGYVLGPLGVIVMFLSKDKKHKECPYCNKTVFRNSYFCPKCHQKIGL